MILVWSYVGCSWYELESSSKYIHVVHLAKKYVPFNGYISVHCSLSPFHGLFNLYMFLMFTLGKCCMMWRLNFRAYIPNIICHVFCQWQNKSEHQLGRWTSSSTTTATTKKNKKKKSRRKRRENAFEIWIWICLCKLRCLDIFRRDDSSYYC